MPCTLTVDHARRRATGVAVDPLSVEDVVGMITAQADAGAWTYPLLHDGRATSRLLTSEEVRRIIYTIESISARLQQRRGPVAMVKAEDGPYGMARMYSLLVADISLVEVFKDIEAAKVWLASQSASAGSA